MSESLGSAVLTLTTDDKGLDAGLARGEAKAEATADKFTRIGGRMKDIGTNLSVAMTLPIGAFAVASANAASDAQELQSAFDVTFGAMAGDMTEWARATGDAMGRSTQEIQGAANTFGMFFNQAAPTKKLAAEMSQSFAVLAQDLSSFYNVDPGDALAKLRSGLSGETEPLRDFGVFINEATMKTKALEMGLKGASGELTEQQKIMVRAAIIMDATKNAQGDVARTSAGTANQVRAATAAWEELQVAVGTKLLPIFTPLISGVASVLNYLTALPGPVQTTIAVVAALAAAAGPLLIVFGMMSTGIGTLMPLVAGLGPALAGIGGFGGVAAAGLAPLSPILLPLAAAVGAVWLAWQNWDKIAPILQGVAVQAQTQTATIDSYLKRLTEGVDAFDRRMGVPSKDEAFASIARAVADTWRAVNQYDLARWAAGVDAAIARSFASAIAWSQRLAVGVRQWLVTNLGAVFEWVRSRIQGVGDKFKWLWDVVVGHSYIPDLVDDIGREMKRLDAELVAPTNRATDAAAKAFRDLQQRVRPLLDRLFPDRAQFNQFRKDLDDLAAYAKSAKWSDDMVDEARGRLADEYYSREREDPRVRDAMKPYEQIVLTVPTTPTTTIDLPELPDMKMGPRDQDQWREDFRRTFHEGLRAAMNGDLGDFLSSFFEENMSRAFDRAVDWLLGLLDGVFDKIGSGVGGGTGGGIGSLLSGLFSGFFATGGLIPSGTFGVVGERGPEPVIASPKGALVRPNSTLSSSMMRAPTPSINMPITIDATGADAAAIGRLNTRLDQLRADLPGTIVKTVQDAGERRMLVPSLWR